MELAISIIIPTLNEEKYIVKLLKSISEQTKHPKEVIIADAGSDDKTVEIGEKYKAKVIKNCPRKGPANGRNIGAKHATQPLLLFLDSDVILPPTFLEETTKQMEKRRLDLASSFYIPITKNKLVLLLAKLGNYYFFWISKIVPHAGGFCIFAKREIHEKIKGFDETLFMGEDHEYVKRAKKFGKFGYIRRPKIHISTRRFQEEGVIKTSLKYFVSELYTLFRGKHEKGDFDFEFGRHHKE